MKVYQRTENGVTTTVSQKTGMDEINHAQMGGRPAVKEMSSITRTDYAITYKDGRDVRLVLTEVTEDTVLTAQNEGEAILLRAERQEERRAIAAQVLASRGYEVSERSVERVVSYAERYSVGRERIAQMVTLPESPALAEVSRVEAGDPIADAYLEGQAATPAPAEEPERALLYRRNDGNHVYGPVLTFKGKRYVLDGGVSERTGRVNYFSVRNGERFGPVRDSFPTALPGTVGYAVAIFARGMVQG